jgi:hypothetical protein
MADPAAAIAWCQENGIDVSGQILSAAVTRKPLDAVQYISSLPAGAERDRLLEKAIPWTPLTKPPIKAETAELILGWLEQLPPDAQERAVYNLGRASANRGKIEDVSAWTERLSEPALRATAVEAVAGLFATQRGGREKLLAQFPSGPERDGALAGIAAHESNEMPERAAKTALEIADPAKRHDVLDSIVGGWIERSPAQAREWIRNARTLPSDWTNAWLAEVGS